MSATARGLLPVTALLALGVAAALAHVASVIPLAVSLDYNEGWNAYHAAAVMAGKGPYPPPQSYLVNNYPPLSFYLIGWIGRLTGDPLVAGRVVNLASTAALSALVFTAARKLHCGRVQAGFATLFLLAVLIQSSDYIGINDPQMLALATAMGGFVVLLDTPLTSKRLALAAMLFTAAFFVKHNVIALPVAAALWLSISDRPSAGILCAWGVGFLIAGLIAFRLGFGFDLWSRLLSARQWSAQSMMSGTAQWAAWNALPLLALIVIVALRRDAGIFFCALYAVVAIALGAYFIGGEGVDPNAMFEADIAMALATAFVLQALGKNAVAASLAYTAPLIVGALLLGTDWRDADYWRRPLAEERSATKADVAFLKAHRGPAICATLALCYWSGKTFPVDVFNTNQQFLVRARDEQPFLEQLASRKFTVVQFEPGGPYFKDDVHEVLTRAYRRDHEDVVGTFYVPR